MDRFEVSDLDKQTFAHIPKRQVSTCLRSYPSHCCISATENSRSLTLALLVEHFPSAQDEADSYVYAVSIGC
jgi:hypothetical protein